MNERQGNHERLNLARPGLILVLAAIALWTWSMADTHLSAQRIGDDDAPLAVTQPALSITKAVAPTTEIPCHGTVTYTVVLGNSGLVSDTNVFLTDTLPAEVDFGRWMEQPVGAKVVADELTWQGTVTAGESITFTFVVSHVGAYGDTVTNTARFSGTLQASEDSATFTVVGPEPAMVITKGATPMDDVPYHDAVTYTVVLTNGGLVSDTSVLLTDTLPAEVDFNQWVEQPIGAEVVDDELTWSGTVTAGQSITFTFVVSHVGDYGDMVTNTAEFSGTLQAGDDSATFTVVGRAMHTTYLPLAIRDYQIWIPVVASYGGSDWDAAYAIQQTTDGGYVVAGRTRSFGAVSEAAWVLKLDADESVAWQKIYGGEKRGRADAIQQTADGGYVVAGWKWSVGSGWSDAWVLKLNADGSVAWQKIYGGPVQDAAYAIQQTADGGYVVAGTFGADDYDAWVLKLDTDGSVAWQKTYGGADSDYAYAIQQTADGGYVMAGWTESFGAGGRDAWVLKLDADGGIVWQKTCGEAGSDEANAIEQTADGGYVMAGRTYSFEVDNYDVWVLKLHADGSTAWQKTYGGMHSEHAYAIQQTADGGYVVAGYTYSFGAGGSDAWVLKLDADGSIAWQKIYGGASLDHVYAIEQTADGGYVVAGYTYSFGAGADVWVLKLDADGGFCAGCELGEASSATVADGDATVADSNVMAVDSDAMVADSSATVNDTNVIPNPICFCFQPDLSVTKIVTPTTEVSYHGAVTYSVVLDNVSLVSDTNVLLTDTLPTEVVFSQWVKQPAGAEVVGDELIWQGTVTAGQALTFTFVVSHVGEYGDVVTNTARFSGTLQTGEDSATFTVTEPILSMAAGDW